VPSASAAQQRFWSSLTVALLVVGYAGFYLCRSDLSVARPLISKEFAAFDKAAIGAITSAGTLFYALGKFIFGSTADAIGGRCMFLFGMGGAVVFTLLFGWIGAPIFLVAWIGNRFVQAAGWGGIVKVASRWFAFRDYGRVMGVVSLSFLFGDFASRLFLGELIKHGWGWREVFFVSGAVLAAIFLPTFLLLRDAPAERGLPEPEATPLKLTDDKMSVGDGLKALLTNSTFWTVCVLSFGFTMMRETFNEWTPTYLHEWGKLAEGDAATKSSLFPLFGGLSVLLVGWLRDRMGTVGQAKIIAVGLVCGTVGLVALRNVPSGDAGLATALVATVAFMLIGPYSLLAGAISLDFGGKASSASAAGWIDGIGYVGGILSGYSVAKVAKDAGWSSAFGLLAAVAGGTALVAFLYIWRESTRSKASTAPITS